MKHLLDVNFLIAGIVQSHSKHSQVHSWLSGKEIVLCPIVELGFLRISTNAKSAIGLTMDQARDRLERFAVLRNAERIPDDLPALASRARTHDQVTETILRTLPPSMASNWSRLTLRLNMLLSNCFPSWE